MGILRRERRRDQTRFIRASDIGRSEGNGPIPVPTPLPLYLDEETLASFAAERSGKSGSDCDFPQNRKTITLTKKNRSLTPISQSDPDILTSDANSRTRRGACPVPGFP